MAHSAAADALPRGEVTVSVVSHGQSHLVNRLLKDLERCPAVGHIIITQNTSRDAFEIPPALASCTRLIANKVQKGFGENHNAAFTLCETRFFCVINPDIRIEEDPFPELVRGLDDPTVGLVAPLILNSLGRMEDSARRFPSPFGLLLRVMGISPGTYDMPENDFSPDWVAGMFMLFRSETFAVIKGFDSGFFLYCEDADICLRLARTPSRLILSPRARAIHDAQRSSHRQLKYLWWHVSSLMRLWAKHPLRALSL